MTSFWPSNFDSESFETPKSILTEQAKILAQLTNGRVTAEVVPLKGTEPIIYSLRGDFAFSFDLVGPYLENYRYTIFRFTHGIVVYPVTISMDETIAKEIEPNNKNHPRLNIETPQDFEEILKRTFRSNRMQKIVGSILSLSKDN